MSSTITETEVLAVQKVQVLELQDKRDKLVRSSSIDRLKRFNAYICSQNYYYFLPGLLLWLRTSQSLSQTYVERGIMCAKSALVFCALRLFQKRAKLSTDKLARDAADLLRLAVAAARREVTQFFGWLARCAQTLAVYLAVVAVFAELVVMVNYLSGESIPLGFVFLVSCVLYIMQLMVRICYNGMLSVVEARSSGTTTEPPISRKVDLRLLEKTISNVNLL